MLGLPGGLLLPEGPLRLNRGSALTSGMSWLSVPDDFVDATADSSGSRQAIRNLAEGQISRTDAASGGNTDIPPIGRGQLGRVWNFNTGVGTNFIPIIDDIRGLPWRPWDFGGYTPGTIFAVATSFGVDSYRRIFGQYRFTFNEFHLTFWNDGTILAAINSGSVVPISSAYSVGVPYAIAFTSRSQTDHQLRFRNLLTGAVSNATSTSNCGSSATDTGSWRLAIGSTGRGGDQLRNGHIYITGFWARGMSQAEIDALLLAPFSLVEGGRAHSYVVQGAPTSVDAELAVTLDDVAMAAEVDVPLVASLAVTLDNVTMDASVVTDVTASLSTTLDDVSLYASAQVGDGVSGEVGGALGITLDDVTMDAEVTVEVIADLAVTLADVTMSTIALSGTNGPFAQRPFLFVN